MRFSPGCGCCEVECICLVQEEGNQLCVSLSNFPDLSGAFGFDWTCLDGSYTLDYFATTYGLFCGATTTVGPPVWVADITAAVSCPDMTEVIMVVYCQEVYYTIAIEYTHTTAGQCWFVGTTAIAECDGVTYLIEFQPGSWAQPGFESAAGAIQLGPC